jgi:hypothetical protein
MSWAEPSLVSEAFGYTVGLTEKKHPELLISGLWSDFTADFLNIFAHGVAAHGQIIKPGLLPLSAERDLYVLEVDHPACVMAHAYGLYRWRVRGLQLVWPDEEGKYPWAPDAKPGHQVLFGEPPRG